MKKYNGTTLLVDSGNLLCKSPDGKKLLDQDILTATAILDIYKTIGYDAMAVGPNDLAAGIDLLRASVKSGSPWVSANLLTTSGSPVFPPWIIRQTPSGRIGILGLTAMTSLPPGYTLADWQDVLPAYLDMLYPACDLIIVLSNLSSETNEEIATKYPQLHLIVSSDLKKGNVPPILAGNALLTQTHSRGRYLGIIKADWPATGIWGNTPEQAAGVRTALLDDLNRQITALTENPHQSDETLLARLHAKKSTLENAAAGGTGSEAGIWTFQFQALTDKIKEDEAINQKIAELRQRIVENNKKLQEGGLKPSLETTSAGRNSGEQLLAGPGACNECHAKQYSQWRRTAHADALQSLRNEQQQYNIRCLACHVTREPSGATDESPDRSLLELPEELQTVSCEACHGPGRAHGLSKGETALRPVSEATCRACHTREMDDDFRYQEKIAKLGCLN